MIVRNLGESASSHRQVRSTTSKSTRLLLAEDGMGFSLNVTEIEAGLEIRMCYQHHLEAVYCVSGTGCIEDEATGKIHNITTGTIYAET
jgi:L-ectoine synthase